MVAQDAATRLQSLWRGRAVRQQRPASDTRELLPVSGGSTNWRANADGVPAWVVPAGGNDPALSHDLTRLTGLPELTELSTSTSTGIGTGTGTRESLVSPGGAARRRLQLRALAMVAMSGGLFALQGASVKLAQDEAGGGTFAMVTARGLAHAARSKPLARSRPCGRPLAPKALPLTQGYPLPPRSSHWPQWLTRSPKAALYRRAQGYPLGPRRSRCSSPVC